MTGGLIGSDERTHPVVDADAAVLLPQHLRLSAVSAHGWRVVDGRGAAGRPGRVPAFIELQPDGFEVMQLGAGFECETFGSLRLAVDQVCATANRLAGERPAL